MNIGIVIQARMGSTRLPQKVLMPIASKPLLAHVVGRLHNLQHSTSVVVATSTLEQDTVIKAWCDAESLDCFRGSEQDVLQRYTACAKHYCFDHVVRLTADNPFPDIEELDRLLSLHLASGFDYTHSFGGLPIGVGAEVFKTQALIDSEANGHAPHHREHVNEYIPEHPELFRIGVLDVPIQKHAPELRMTVDTHEDWRKACWLAEQASTPWLQTEEAIKLCSHYV